eukprot:TRINITY_DN61317_c0_g1_i1.p1 TRINITY_DN61317_c0_g1~~TRINITY_DN61317_c0_g1_i1.p1  ORF type:complete len:423 (+),score=68.28 TRINITY_DN61317_c0_g1_i1:73-1341(+)
MCTRLAGRVFLSTLTIAPIRSTATLPSSEDCGGVDPLAWLAPSWSSPGYHVLCISNPAAGCRSGDGGAEGQCQAEGAPTARVCWGGLRDACEDLEVEEALAAEGKQGLLKLQEKLTASGKLANKKRFQKLNRLREKKSKLPLGFAFFGVESDRAAPKQIKSLQGESGLLLAFEGGSFIWPGIEIGFRRNVTIRPENSAALDLTFLTRSLRPLVVEISSFLDARECQHIIDKALPHIKKSTVSHMDHDVGKPDTNWRSSSTYFMHADDDVLHRLDDRVTALTVIPKNHQEPAQILRYEKTERYVSHNDYFDVNAYAQNKDIQQMTTRGLFNRLATVFFYLSDVEEGGETNFPMAGGLAQPRDFGDCSKGVSVHPKTGRIMIFYSQDASGRLDELSLHGGCEVKKGTKWSANKWIWNKPMGFVQ